jgi:hypothetical protein
MAGKGTAAALALAAAGTLLAWSGIKGKNWTAGLRDLIAGQSPLEAGSIPIVPSSGSASEAVDTSGVVPGQVGSPTRGVYSEPQIKALWLLAGGTSNSAGNAVCHALQESSGSATVTSRNPDGGTNVGLWQLDTRGVGAGHSVSQLQNPLTNARLTVKATNDGQNWSQWATPGC